MKRSLSFIGCGLLVVALGSVGCSKKSSNGGTDAGSSTSTGGSGTAGKAGGGAAGKAGGGAGGGAAGMPSTAECTTMTTAKSTAPAPGTPAKCAACVCMKNLAAADACLKDAQCWNLVNCIGSMCGANGSDTTCITGKCASSLAGATAATALMIPTMCAAECGSMTTAPAPDGGTDAGN